MAKTIQPADAPSGADDSYERATAFLSDWIEDSFLIPTAKISHQDQRHQRWFSPPVPDLPLPSVRLRRRNNFTNSNDSRGNGGAINSLVNSLQTSLMLHEQHQNQARSSQHGITSPSSVGAIFEPSSGGIGGVPPPPFERPTATQQQLARDFQQDASAFSRRSVVAAAAAPSLRSTRCSGNEDERELRWISGGNTARPQSSGITKGHGAKHHYRSNKDENSSRMPPCSRRHTFDSDRSFKSSYNSCACVSTQNQARESFSRDGSASIDGLDESELHFSVSMGSLHDHRRRTSSRHVHWSNRSDGDLPSPTLHRHNNGDCRSEEEPPTMVVSLPWTDLAGNEGEGHYTGEVNASIQPHGSGVLRYDFGTVVTGLWNNGSPTTIDSSTSKGSQVPSPVPFAKKENIETAVTVEAMENDGTTAATPPSRKRGNEKKSPSKTVNNPKTKSSRKNSRRHTEKAIGGNPSNANTAKSISSTSTQPPVQPSLERLGELDGAPNFDLGDTCHSTKYQIIETNPSKSLNLIHQLRIHDFAWILRSSRKWTYAIIADFPVKGGEEASIRFVIDKLGNTKTLKINYWAKCIRLVAMGETMTCRSRPI